MTLEARLCGLISPKVTGQIPQFPGLAAEKGGRYICFRQDDALKTGEGFQMRPFTLRVWAMR